VFESDENVKTELARTPRSGFVQPCAAANGGIASLLQSSRFVAAVAELGSFGGVRTAGSEKLLRVAEEKNLTAYLR